MPEVYRMVNYIWVELVFFKLGITDGEKRSRELLGESIALVAETLAVAPEMPAADLNGRRPGVFASFCEESS
jgi:hypothetical protein